MHTYLKIKILVILILCNFLPLPSKDWKSNIRINHLTTEQGLSQNYIMSILQDKRGFIWFATWDGLNRYDGYTFAVYKHNPDDTTTISSNFILDLFEDNQGNLWVATNGGGINKFDPLTEHATRYQHNSDNPNSLCDISVESIIQDSYGYFWFGTPNKGLNKFDPVTETFTHFLNDTDGQFVGRITSVIEDNQKNIRFVGEHGLYHLNLQTKQISRSTLAFDNLSADYLYEDTLGNLWILSWDPAALIKYNPGTGHMTKYPNDAIGIYSCNLFNDGKHGFWIPSKKGLFYFNRQTEQFDHIFQSDRTNPEGLNDNYVPTIYQDKNGLLWLGTVTGGINLVNFQQEQFGYEQHQPGNSNTILPRTVFTIHVDYDGILWLGYTPRALSRFDRSTGQISHYIPNPKDKNSLNPGYNINSIYKDAQGYVWLGGWEGGLVRFDERTGLFKKYLPNPGDPNSLISNNTLCIYEDRDGTFWLGQHGGLSRFNPETEQFTHFMHEPGNPTSLGAYSVRCIYQDRSGILWIGTWQGVLSRLDVTNGTFVNYNPAPYTQYALRGGSIYAIHESPPGSLWLAASDGLYQYNRENERFIYYNEKHGLPSNNVQGILEDGTGKLWLSTKKGLSRFDPQTGIFKNYDKSDGLQSDDFSEACFDQSQNGEMFFGGSNGINAFFPDSIRDDPNVPPIVITDFRLFGQSVPVGKGSLLQKTINETKSLTLQYNQNNISFGFSALSYTSPVKNLYRYTLEGFDTDWRNVGSKERLAVYTNLPAGNYVFRVQGTNQDGVWNREGKSINIKILTPWWQTLWFRGGLILLIAASVYGGIRLRIMSAKKQNIQLENLVNKRTLQLKTANKELEAFAYSVSHDLRAPLRSIDGFSQVLLEEFKDNLDKQGQDYLNRVRKAAQRMAQLIDDMLNLSRVTRSEMKIREVNLSSIAKEVANDLQQAETGRKVEFIIKNNIVVKADEQLLRIVVVNLMGNAWKFTSKKPSARIEFSMVKKNGINTCYIKDNGAGFDMKYAKKLFGAFQRMHSATDYPGTGIGLATVQRIIHRHGGKIWAESEVDNGAVFYFTLP